MSEQKKFAGKFHFWFNLIMMTLYAIAGILLLFTVHLDALPEVNTKMMGIVLLLYAAYRGYRLYKTFSVHPETDQEHANQ